MVICNLGYNIYNLSTKVNLYFDAVVLFMFTL